MRLLAWAWLVVGGLAVLAPNAHAAGAKADVIEDVNSKQLENLVADSDYVAVFWYKKGCKDCDKVLEELENIDDDTDRFGVHFVKIADKKFAKAHGVKTFPALSFFRNKEPIHYEGDLMDESGVLEFLTSLEAMELPDQIEEVNAKILDKIVEEQEFVAVLFCYMGDVCNRGEHKNECRRCVKALQELENVDDDADQLGIAFVKINDPELADEYSLGSLPALVYYRRRIPVVYDGDLMNEDKVLEWLVENKNTGDDDDVIDDVTLGLLNTLIDSLDHLAVVFYDREDSDDTMILQELENIDDDLDAQGIHIVKIADDVAEREYGIEDTPCLVYFEKEIPSLYDGDLHKEQEVLAWLVEQLHTDEIEDITDEMLDKLIRESSHLAVLFYKEDEQDSELVVTELENIDDDCDARGISFVKIDNDDEAKEYGIDVLPTLVYFEKGVPSVYSGNLLVEEQVLDWLVHQVEEDEIEEVTDEMLDRLIERTEHLAVLFYDKESRRSRKVVAELENIDDECDGRGVYFVKIDNYEEAMEYGIDTIPTLVYFESEIPYIFEGDLMKEEEVLYWLFHHVDHEEIADVTDEMLGKLIANEPFLAVLFYDKDDAEDHEVLGELENIDDDCEQAGVPFVKIDNDAEAREYGIDDLPTLVYFENRIPSIYEGDLSNEQEVLEWLLEQKNSDTIEEVTDEILDDLIANFEYVVVYFSGECDEGQKCDHILNELENIDDDTDDHGMHFVTTEETGLANNYGIKVFPALAIFRNGEPLLYKGDLTKEEAVLKWVTAEDTLQIPNQIEEVNQRMLERILNTSDNVAVFFYDENDKKSRKILIELENIDDDCDDIGIDFVKISDEGIAQEYDIASMPAIVYFRHRFPQIYEGDMTDEEALLEWLIDNKDRGPASIIEEVDGKMLQNLVDTFEFLVVYFYDDNCPTCETILAELETIDDETDEVGIQFVKTNDVDVAEDLGISHLPALVYFEGGVPSIYDGDFARGAEVLSWLVAHTRHIDASLEALTSRLVVPGGAQEAGEGGGGSEGERTGVAEELEDDSADSSAQKMYDDNGDATAQDDIDDDAIDDDSSDTNAQDYSEDDDTLDGDNDDATAEDNGDDNDTVDDDGDDDDDASAQDDSEDDNAVDDDDNNDATPQDDSEDDDAIDDDGTTAQSNSDDDNTVDDDDDDDSTAQDDSEDDDTVDDDNDDSTAQDDSEDDDTVEDDDRDGNDNNSECVCGQMCDEEKHVESQDEDFQHMKSDERENKTVGAIKEEINEEPDKIDNEGDSYTGEIGSEDMQTVVISGEDEIEEHDYKAEESGNKSSIEDGNDEVKDGAGEKQVNKIVKRKKEVKTQKRSSKKDDKITDNKKNEKDISTVNETVSGSVKTFNVARHAHPIPKVEKKVRNNSNKTGKSYAAKGRKRRFEEQAEAAGSKRGWLNGCWCTLSCLASCVCRCGSLHCVSSSSSALLTF
ncbi:uncharacterized protein LOC126995938 isoform X6 [Eriocheir sinensis]|uniref:uncharacterized protein LOC126995938 isoform X6 n=1 Tax=Eriocheir sinensis TaxID=95602 RepID=UPI0021C98851|nr:uncharacterized protein LOC126995938 isoform X6 [Eriocheir sinensis]